jgi:hypothetical protein
MPFILRVFFDSEITTGLLQKNSKENDPTKKEKVS